MAERDPLSNYHYFDYQLQQARQNSGVEPNAAIHLFDSRALGTCKLENNPAIIYRVVFRAFLIKVYVHRSKGIIAPSDCLPNEGYIDLVNPQEGTGMIHRITARLGPNGTISLRDLSEPDGNLLEAVSGRWFHETLLEAVETDINSAYRAKSFYPGVEGRAIPNNDGITHTLCQQPAIILSGHEHEANAYEAFFASGACESHNPEVLQPQAHQFNELFVSSGSQTPVSQQQDPGSSSGHHHPQGTPQGFQAGVHNFSPPQYQRNEGAPSGLHAGTHNTCPPLYQRSEGVPSGLQAGAYNTCPPQYYPAKQPVYKPIRCSESGPAVQSQPQYVARSPATSMGFGSRNLKTEQNRVDRANRKRNIASQVERGIAREMRLKAAESMRLGQEKTHAEENKVCGGTAEQKAEYASLLVRLNELERLEMIRKCDPDYPPLQRAVDENKAKLQAVSNPALNSEDIGPEYYPLRRSLKRRGLSEEDAEDYIRLLKKGHIDPPQEIKDELEEDLSTYAEIKALKRAWYTRHSSKVQEVQKSLGSGVERTKIVFPQELKDKQPRSPRVPGEDDVLRADSDDDMVT
jgi:hypothetical protein